jgi:hypothetical protein
LAAHCIDRRERPSGIRNDPQSLADFQSLLKRQGFELTWPS